MARGQKNEEQKEQAQADSRAERAAADSGSVDMIANVDLPYENSNGDVAYAYGFQHFQTSEQSASELFAQGKASYAKEDEEGNYVVDNERGEQARQESLTREAEERVESFDLEASNARYADNAVGMKGSDANESNDMPAGDGVEERPGRFVDQGNAIRERELHEQAGVSRQVG